MNVRIKANLRATCNNIDQKYSSLHSAKKNSIGITPATFPNENMLNASLSELLGKLFTNQAILFCLVEKTPP